MRHEYEFKGRLEEIWPAKLPEKKVRPKNGRIQFWTSKCSLHNGQVWFIASHGIRHLLWNAWRHFAPNTPWSPLLNRDKQIVHFCTFTPSSDNFSFTRPSLVTLRLSSSTSPTRQLSKLSGLRCNVTGPMKSEMRRRACACG